MRTTKTSARSKQVWTCDDESEVRVCDMTDSHLHNALRWVERQPETVMECFGTYLGDGDCDIDVTEALWTKDDLDRDEWIEILKAEIVWRQNP